METADNTGDYLKWTSSVEGGTVGSYGGAYVTHTVYVKGTDTGANSSIWNLEN